MVVYSGSSARGSTTSFSESVFKSLLTLLMCVRPTYFFGLVVDLMILLVLSTIRLLSPSQGAAGKKSGGASSESSPPDSRQRQPAPAPEDHDYRRRRRPDDDDDGDGSSSSGRLDLSDSLVIGEADMEVGGYARAREEEELRRSKDATIAAAVASAAAGVAGVTGAAAAGTAPRPAGVLVDDRGESGGGRGEEVGQAVAATEARKGEERQEEEGKEEEEAEGDGGRSLPQDGTGSGGDTSYDGEGFEEPEEAEGGDEEEENEEEQPGLQRARGGTTTGRPVSAVAVGGPVGGGRAPGPPSGRTLERAPPSPPASPPPSPPPPPPSIQPKDDSVAGDEISLAHGEGGVLSQRQRQLQQQPPPSPPPPPPSHLPEDERRSDEEAAAGWHAERGDGVVRDRGEEEGGWKSDAVTGLRSTHGRSEETAAAAVAAAAAAAAAAASAAAATTAAAAVSDTPVTIARGTTPSFLRYPSAGRRRGGARGGYEHGHSSPVTQRQRSSSTSTLGPERVSDNRRPRSATVASEGEAPTRLRAPNPGDVVHSRDGDGDDNDHHRHRHPASGSAWDEGAGLPGRGRITDSPVTSSGGLWDVPTAAPSLAELEYQLSKLSPLRGVRTTGPVKARGGAGAGVGAAAAAGRKYPAVRSGGRAGARVGGRVGGYGGGGGGSGGGARGGTAARSRSAERGRQRRQEGNGGGGGGANGRDLGRREEARGRFRRGGRVGETGGSGGGGQVDDEQAPAGERAGWL